MKITSIELAKICGVSRRSIHRALTNSPSISPKTREKILRAAQKYHYTPSYAAQALRTGRSDSIGLLVGHIQDVALASKTAAIVSRAQELGKQVVVSASEWGEGEEQAYRMLMSHKVDGIISLLRPQQKYIADIKKSGLPIAFLSHDDIGCTDIANITIKYTDAFSDALKSFAPKLKEKKAGLLQIAKDSQDKINDFCEACYKNSFEQCVLMVENENWHDDNCNEYARIITENPSIGLWFVQGEQASFRLIQHLNKINHRIPGKLNIVIIDGCVWYKIIDPPIPAIVYDYDQAAQMLVEAVLEPAKTKQTQKRFVFCRFDDGISK